MDNNNQYDNTYNPAPQEAPPTGRKGLAIASMIVGILSIPLACCTGYIGVIGGLVAILLGIFSKGNAPTRSGMSIAGIVTGAVALVLGAILLVITFTLMNDPEFMDQYNELLQFYNR